MPSANNQNAYNEELMGYRQSTIIESPRTKQLIDALNKLEAQQRKSNSNYKSEYYNQFTKAIDDFSKTSVKDVKATQDAVQVLFKATNRYLNAFTKKSNGNNPMAAEWKQHSKEMASLATDIFFANLATGRKRGKNVPESHARKSTFARYLGRSAIVDEAKDRAKKMGRTFNEFIAYNPDIKTLPASLKQYKEIISAQNKEDILATGNWQTSTPITPQAIPTSGTSLIDNMLKNMGITRERLNSFMKQGGALADFPKFLRENVVKQQQRSSAHAGNSFPRGDYNLSDEASEGFQFVFGSGQASYTSTLSTLKSVTKELMGPFAKALNGVGNLFKSMTGPVAAFGDSVGSAFSALAADDPIAMITGFTQGLSKMTTTVTDFFSGVFGAVGSMLGGGGGGNGNGNGGGGKGGAATAILGGVSNLISGAFSLFSSGINTAFSVFNGLLTGITGILKKLLKTSPIFSAIFDILNLAFTLFFMPFFNAFAETLLPVVLGMLDWALENGEKFSEMLKSSGVLDVILGGVQDFAKSIMEVVASEDFRNMIVDIIGLIPTMLNFASVMLKFFTSHSDRIVQILEKGFDFFGEMLDAGILDEIFDFSKWMLDWMKEHADDVRGWISGIFDLVKAIGEVLGIAQGIVDVGEDFNEYASKRPGVPSANLIMSYAADKAWGWLKGAIGLASGGIVPATPGGTLAWIGEGGRSEAVIPLDETDTLGGTKQIVIQFTGNVYGMNDFETKVQQIVNNTANRAYFR